MKKIILALFSISLLLEIFLVKTYLGTDAKIHDLKFIHDQVEEIMNANSKLDKEVLLYMNMYTKNVDGINYQALNLYNQLVDFSATSKTSEFNTKNFTSVFKEKLDYLEKLKSYSGVTRNSLNYLMNYIGIEGQINIPHIKQLILRYQLNSEIKIENELQNLAEKLQSLNSNLSFHIQKYIEFRKKIKTYMSHFFNKELNHVSNELRINLDHKIITLDEKQHNLQAMLLAVFTLILGFTTFLSFLIRKAKLEEQRTQSMLESIVNAAQEAIVSIDHLGKIILVNGYMEKLSGYKKDELIGKNISMIVPSPHKDLHDSYLSNYLKTGKHNIIGRPRELFMEGKDGNQIPIILSVSEYEFEGKRFYSGVLHNISEIVESRKRIAMTSRLASIGELASGVGHEINNPLAIIKSTIDLIAAKAKKGSFDNEQLIKLIQKQSNAVDRIRTISNGLRTYSHMDVNALSIVNLKEIIDSTIELIQSIYSKSGIHFNIDMNSPDYFVKGNKGKLQQIVLNLISNAKDALEGRDNPEISVHIDEIDGYYQLSIKDNGSGIPQKIQDKIFESFYTTKEIGKGTGLGLSIVKNFVEEMQGTITLVSEKDIGTCFTIKLPKGEISHVINEENESEITFQPLSGNVLLVEDEIDLNDLFTEQLKLWGLKVSSAYNGEEALKLAEENNYDLVVTDIQMPKMNGIELIERLFVNQKIDIIIISGGVAFDQNEKAQQIIQTKVNAFLSKPVDLSQLYLKISECLNT